MKKHTIKNGDTVNCFNGTTGIVTSFDYSNYHLTVEYKDLKMETHIQNICTINGITVDPIFENLVYENR